MDPLSVIGLLASISTLVRVSNEALELMKTFKDGEKELATLVHDVSVFEEALRGFDRVLRSRQTKHNISAHILQNAIEESFASIRDIERRLSQINKSGRSAVRRMKWVQNKSGFERIDEHIKAQSAQLHSFVSLAHLETFLAVCNQNPQLLDACSHVAEEMEMESESLSRDQTVPLPETSTAPLRKTRDTALLAPENLTSSHRRSISSSRSSISSTKTSIFSTNSSVSRSSTLVSSDNEDITLQAEAKGTSKVDSVQENSLIIRQACRFDCYCQCHAQSIAVSSEVFSSFNSPMFQEKKGHRVECTDPDCVGATASHKRAVPSTFFRKALSRLKASQTIKIRYHLNTYRMVPEGSNAMRYVKQGNLEGLKGSIKSGEATPWDTAPDGWSLLHTAAYARQLPIVQYLCGLGADTEVADLGARKPVDLAILKSLAADATKTEKDIVQVFSKKDDYISDFEFTPIHIVVLDLYDPADAERPTLEQLIEFVDNANNAPPGTNWASWKSRFQRRSPLFTAIIEQFRAWTAENPTTHKVIHNLLDQKDRKFHWTPLHWAGSTGRADKMKILVDHGADPFIQSNLNANIFHAAVESDARSSLTYALAICERYPDQLNINQPNVWGESPLIMAAQGCLVGCVRLLLEAGADRNVRQENQQVALHYAGLAHGGDNRRETVALLCGAADETGSHINSQDEDGRPPLFDLLDDLECVKLLLSHGAILDLLDNSGKSVFHHVCIQDEPEVLKHLQVSADSLEILKQKDNDGNTAFLEAMRYENVDCATILLNLDDIGDMVGQDGWAAIHYAAKLGDADLLEAVLKHPNTVKGAKTGDGKTTQVVAMEAGHWCGRVKDLLKRFNCIT